MCWGNPIFYLATLLLTQPGSQESAFCKMQLKENWVSLSPGAESARCFLPGEESQPSKGENQMKSEVIEKQRQREQGYWWHFRPGSNLLPALPTAQCSVLFAGPFSPPTSPSLPAPIDREESRGILIHPLKGNKVKQMHLWHNKARVTMLNGTWSKPYYKKKYHFLYRSDRVFFKRKLIFRMVNYIWFPNLRKTQARVEMHTSPHPTLSI